MKDIKQNSQSLFEAENIRELENFLFNENYTDSYKREQIKLNVAIIFKPENVSTLRFILDSSHYEYPYLTLEFKEELILKSAEELIKSHNHLALYEIKGCKELFQTARNEVMKETFKDDYLKLCIMLHSSRNKKEKR